jgi:serine phosphatase RsbU (regulator of sigma subunit)/GAF domain-containing protein
MSSGVTLVLLAPLDPQVTSLLALLVLLAAVGFGILLARLQRRREAELQTLAALAMAVSSAAEDPAEVAEAAYVHAARLLPVDFFQLGMFQGETYRTLIWVRDGNRVRNRDFSIDPQQEGLVGYIRRTGEPLLVPDFQRAADLPVPPSYAADDPPSSGLFVPLVVENAVVGILAVQSRRVNAFRRRELLLLRALASSVATSLAAITWREQLHQRERQIALVEEVGGLLAPLRPLPEALAEVATQIQQRMETGLAAIFEISGDQMAALAVSGRPEARTLEQPAIRSIVREAADSKRLIHRSREIGGLPGAPHLTWECVCPLRVQDRVLGVLYLSRRQDRFRRQDRRLAEVVANQLALAFLESANYLQQQEEAWFTTVLLEVARAAAQPGDVAAALQAVLELTTLLAGAKWTLLLMVDPASGGLAVGPSAGLRRATLEGLSSEVFSPEDFELEAATSDETPRPRTLPPSVARATGSSGAMGSILTDGTHMLGLLLVEGEDLQGRRSSLIAGIANQISLRLENAALVEQAAVRRSLERELETARTIQKSFLPATSPQPPGWRVGAFWHAARSVGGDFYDFIPAGRPAGPLPGSGDADVSGHGVPAVPYRPHLDLLHGRHRRPEPGVDHGARTGNLLIHETRGDMFVSLWYGIWEPEAGRVTYSNAGHNPPILFRRNEQCETLRTRHMVLGVMPDVPYEESVVDLSPDSMLLLYTDGVSEAPGDGGQLFGVHRIENIVLGLTDWNPEVVLGVLAERVVAFSGQPDPNDDLTIVCLNRL